MSVSIQSATVDAELPDRFVDRETAAKFLSLSVRTLASWASAGVGPRSVKLSSGRSGAVRYALSELRAYAADPTGYSPRPVARFNKPTSIKQPNVSLARARRKRHGKAKS
jgi:hypothetical protein